MKRFILLIGILLLSINAFSATSGPFYFPGGTIPPKNQFPTGVLHLLLQSLPKYIMLNISCDIENPNFNKPYPVVIRFYEGSLNGMISTSKQYLLNNSVSKYKARLIVTENKKSILFENYDDSDPVYITNCMAVYATD